ncbi:MAG TPA: type 4a pilus biogenesis protein PilO [Terriglobales bacterium]|nr:type 4a pilus biogenesis protein PilO [Terriglobales bacterium]
MKRGGNRPLRPALQRALLVCAALDLILWGLLVSPWSPSRVRAEAHLAAVAARSATLHAQLAALRRVEQHLLASRAQAQQVLAGMPRQRDADYRWLQELQSIAQRAGVRTGAITFQPGRQADFDLLPVRVEVSVSGDYGALVRFINGVERSPLFMIVNEVDLGSERQTQSGGLSLGILIEAYEQAPPGAAAPKKGPTA